MRLPSRSKNAQIIGMGSIHIKATIQKELIGNRPSSIEDLKGIEATKVQEVLANQKIPATRNFHGRINIPL